jgi:hypothetical protein
MSAISTPALPPSTLAEVRHILDREARRILAEETSSKAKEDKATVR